MFGRFRKLNNTPVEVLVECAPVFKATLVKQSQDHLIAGQQIVDEWKKLVEEGTSVKLERKTYC